jgi:hypothetical protein
MADCLPVVVEKGVRWLGAAAAWVAGQVLMLGAANFTTPHVCAATSNFATRAKTFLFLKQKMHMCIMHASAMARGKRRFMHMLILAAAGRWPAARCQGT